MINLLKIKKAGGERPSCGKRAFPPLICFCLYGYRLFLLPCFQVRSSVRTLSSGEYATVGDRPTCRKPNKSLIKGGKVRSSVVVAYAPYPQVSTLRLVTDLPVVNQINP